ncbi:putative nuclease HARBI1 [Oncorhynchus keta]|uniref:putative nuclease HARBI1 n=1 Tax=Oncorhynchus keta TaxID=8018 RepID=UPI00227A5B65|nr:putative nuclease HARBI1 [Oncorhynchus keta]
MTLTLDELAEDEDLERQDSSSKEKYSSSGSSKKIGGLRVVNVVGFKRAYGFLNEILALAKPFGTVVQHLVLDVSPKMVCNADCVISNVVAKWPGSVHDSRIFRASEIYQCLSQGEFSGVLLGDRGYGCQPFLLTPFTDPQEAQQAYNHAHARTRARVEMTFGLLKARFHCLHKLRVSPVRACDITVACAVLHNVACLRKERSPRVPPAMDWDNPSIFPDDDSGRLLRDQYVLNYFS